MGWRSRRRGVGWDRSWPGNGPFSYLPPWQRPGWLFGRGSCWWITPASSSEQPLSTDRERQMLEQQLKVLESQREAIKKRLEELRVR